MTDVTLRVICDRAAATSFGLTFGGGWARVVVTLPPPPDCDWSTTITPFLRTAKVVLDTLGVVPAPLPKPRVFVEGPDAPADVTDAYGPVFRAWATILRGEAPAAAVAAAAASEHASRDRSQTSPGAATVAVGTSAPSEDPSAATFISLAPLSFPPSTDQSRGPAALNGGSVYLRAAAPPATTALPSAAAPPGQRAHEPFRRRESGTPARPAIDGRVVEQMVQTVRSYMSQYGAAPDFRSEKPSAREKAYNYIRSTTASQRVSDTVVEEVRRRLASEQQ